MTKAFLSHEHRSDYNGIPSMGTISERSVDTTDTDDGCANESAEPNDILLKATSNERFARTLSKCSKPTNDPRTPVNHLQER